MQKEDKSLTIIEQLKLDLKECTNDSVVEVYCDTHKDGEVTLYLCGGELVLDTHGTFTYERSTIV